VACKGNKIARLRSKRSLGGAKKPKSNRPSSVHLVVTGREEVLSVGLYSGGERHGKQTVFTWLSQNRLRGLIEQSEFDGLIHSQLR